ncbi:hypothetical protein KUCAC02_016980 [Chaenocephalus aceratus]|nr:hypothetical protein KUCAC02_035142 [Chaenocephalus aceratus]KAI4799348.1 hypothetical protein KUCAC02_016980 [Chaenocephalus aceratus]
MYTLQQYILKQQRAESCPPPAEGCIASATSTLTSSTPVMEEDEELERAMLNLSPSKLSTEQRPPAAVSRAPAVSTPTGFSPAVWRVNCFQQIFPAIIILN